MSLLRSPKLRSLKSTFESIRDRWAVKSRPGARQMKHRRLTVDPLEERTLLSVVAADYDDVLVNQHIDTEQQGTIAAQSVAVDNDGDFVVVWSRYDDVLELDPGTGQMVPVIDPATGQAMLDANIYARYFTDEVQRLTLPDAIDDDNDGNDVAGAFYLTYGGNEVQKIEITATYRPSTAGWSQSNIAGSVTFGFDVNGNSVVGPGETTTVFFNESTEEFTEIAANIQTQLRGLGGALTDVTVTGTNPHEYTVEFGDLSMGQDQPEITVESVNFTSGFLPAVITSTVRELVEVGPIFVSASDPYQTANALEEAFSFTSENVLMGPIDFPPDDRIDPPEGPYYSPAVLRTALPGVSVTPVWELDPTDNLVKPSTTKFDITFDGGTAATEGPSGKQDHPLLVVSQAADEGGANLLPSTEISVETLKEPSPEFRVNPAEPDNPFTQLPDRYNQTNPDVAMDADGEFLITWESDVPDVVQYGTVSDVFARRFSPAGIVDPAEVGPSYDWFRVDTDFDGITDTIIQGVKDLDSGFRVNTTTTGAQGQPAVGVDDEGNFVIAWGSGTEGFSQVYPGQDLGYFNGIRAQQFNRDGTKDGDEFLVNSEVTSIHFDPYVAVSDDGYFVITWSTTDDEDFVQEDGYVVNVDAKVFNPDGTIRRNQFGVGGGGGSSADFDDNNNYAITWSVNADSDNTGGGSTGVRAVMYDINGALLRSQFRANSASFTPSSNTIWPGTQWGAEVAIDADGELVISYEGTGPDVSDDVYSSATFRQALYDLFYKPENADLLQYFDPAAESFPISGGYWDQYGSYVYLGSTSDYDTDLENLLIRASTQPSPANSAQLGRIRALVEEVAGLLQGDQYAVMFSRFDADPDFNNSNILQSDSVANNERDGHNQRYILTIPTTSEGGDFELRLWNAYTGGYEDVQIGPVYNNQVLNIGQTRNEIEDELQSATRTGIHWDSTPGNLTDSQSFDGSVEVRTVSFGFGSISSEVTARLGTPWGYTINDYEVAYEIVFSGEVHDSYIGLSVVVNDLDPDPQPWPRLIELTDADTGTTQHAVSIGMETDGDFVMAWTQNEEHTSGATSNQNIYYRRFTETTDTAGPKLTDLVNHNDEGMADGDEVVGPVQYVVLTFDEELMTGDPDENPDSALNPENFVLFRGDQEIPFGIAKVEFGMNKAADLAGTDDGLGGSYPSAWTASNKWEAVLVIDGNGGLTSGITSLGTGQYTVRARAPRPEDGVSGLRDKAGNALGLSGFRVAGESFERTFQVSLAEPDDPVSGGTTVPYDSGITDPETPGAVAVDSDGDHVVAWTGYAAGHDRVFIRVFDAEGNPAMLPVLDSSGTPTGTYRECPVMWVSPGTEFLDDDQADANVAIDADGDFVVTWTNYRGGNADIYARRFGLAGLTLDPISFTYVPVFDYEPFLVNTYTDGVQQWPDVAMDADGDFVVTWSSYGQEAAEGALGTGWGVYARLYDSFGQPLAPESRVNVTTAGNQQSASVAMSGEGEFVVAWTSDQNGIGDDIVAREFNADGSPKVSPLVGEIVVNDILPGDQRFPDVSMRLDGENYIITWTDSAADISGTSIWAELSRPLPKRFTDSTGHAISGTHRFTINVTDSFTIADLNIQLGILTHQRLEDLRFTLESPSGTQVMLFEDLPRPYLDGTRPTGNTMVGTLFDDETATALRITDSQGGAVPPYNDSYVSQQILTAFDGENSQGVWTLIVEDRLPQNNLVGGLTPLDVEVGSWSLIIDEVDASADSFLVNTTRESYQMYSSVAMDYEGGFVVSWSGYGDQHGQEDASGHGVFYQRFSDLATRIGLERRANSPQNTEGDQWISSVGIDATGNFVIAWTGPQIDPISGAALDETDIYSFVSVNDAAESDDDGPLVTDVLWNDDRVLDGDVLDTTSDDVTELTVVFSEDMSLAVTATGDPDLISVENRDNWVLTRNGSEIIGGVTDVDFGYNPITRRYEAVVSLDGNGIGSGTPGLLDGEYVLAVKDDMTDVSVYFDPNDPTALVAGNRLDGDADGQPGSNPITVGYGAYLHHFIVGGSAANGEEFRVNSEDYVQYEQTFSESAGTGLAREESTRSVAVDHDGDYVVVWTSYGQTAGEPAGADVYFAMFDRYDNPMTFDPTSGEVLEQRVNTFTEGHQRNAAVAMDADGEFVIVWESQGEDPDESWGIYARRYDSMGRPLVSDTNHNGVIDSADTDLPFRVNTEFTRNQLNPSVAMDDSGGFVVVWATAGQDFSFFNDVYAQRYSRFGVAQGLEILVNTFDLPGVQPPPGGSFEINPAVGMSGPSGNFVVAWDVVTAQQNGVVTNSVIAARRFAADGSPQGGEFQADTGTGSGGGDTLRVARNPQVAVDDLSGFIVVWESYMGSVVAAYDVFFQQFDSGGGSIASGQVNMPETLGAGQFADDQVNPSVAIDADGDFAVVWNGQGAQPDPLNPNAPALIVDDDIEGIFIRQYYAASDSDADGIPDLAPAPVTVQSRVNRTEGGIQQFPSIGMEPDGDMIVVWSGRGVGDIHGIFARRYDEQTDTAGPVATELRLEDGTLVPDNPNDDPIDSTDTLVVVFDEHMWTHEGWESGDPWAPGKDPDSVENPANWVLRRNGIEIRDVITGISYGHNNATNKWEAVITFDWDLSAGDYTLTALHPVPDIPETDPDEGQSGLRDAQGNPLALDGFEPGGADVVVPFFVSPLGGDDNSVTGLTGGRTYAEARGATAVDSDGDYVVVYTANIAGVDRVVVRMFDADGTAVTDPFQISTVPGEQRYATVDLDADGDFVVTWTNYDGGDADVYARLLSSEVQGGLPTPMSGAFRVNAYTDHNQKWSDVALDPDGDFVVTWSSYGQEEGGNLGSGYGVYARRFNRFGFPLGGEFQVNVTTGGNQRNATVDMADGGSFVLAWTSDQNGVGNDVIARLFEADGKPKIGPLGGELLVNAGATAGDQSYPDVAITPSGEDFMVVWTSAHDDGSGDGIFARSVNVPLLEEQADPVMEYVWTGSQDFWLGNNARAQIAVPFDIPINNFTIADVDVLVDADHPFTYDVKLTLESPAGTSVVLVENEPDPVTTSSDFAGTIFDDESTIAITDPPPAAVGPYNDPLGYQPEDLVNYGVGFGLDAFDGERSSGVWTLLVQDTVDRGFPTFQNEIARRGTLNEWRLTLTRQPAMGATFQVNTSTLANQNFASIAMNRRGGFTVAWNGRGDQPRQEDTSGSGVFFQQFALDGTPVGAETRANYLVDGDQRYATIGGDAAGGFTMVWTGDLALGVTDVYRALSADFVSNRDLDGPVVSDVLLSDGTPVLQGDTVASGVTELVVAFSEDLSVRDNDDTSLDPGPGPDSILNPDNWVLQRNGSTVSGAIQKVSFALNPDTRKYEAVVSLDASSIGGGTAGLPEGDYVLVVMDTVNDAYDFEAGDPYFSGNALDGDFDGSPGTSAASSGPAGYTHEFHVVPGTSNTVEYRINESGAVSLQQTFSEPLGTGYGREQSTTALAVDHDGDYVAVWTSYGQDDPSDFNSGGIYFRMFNRNDEEIKGETLVNTVTDGNQRNAAVAMDADGDFVVVWESEDDNVDGSWGVYGRMYNSVGEPLGDQFLINTTLQNDQLNPSVAMDDFGNFAVVWASEGQQYSYFNDVVGQLFNYDGDTIGSEFIINSTGVPGTGTGPGNVDLNPAVAMDDLGNFVVAWDQITAQQNGVVTDSEIRARMYDATGAAAGAEFVVGSGIGESGDPDIGRTARNPQVTMQDAYDADGDGQLDPGVFIAVWESTVGGQYDVFFEQFDGLGTSLSGDQVNVLAPEDPDADDDIEVALAAIYGGGQVNPSVGVDADGDFVVVWNGQGARPDPLNPGDPDLASEQDMEGVFVRSYQSNQAAPEAVTVQSRVNRTESGIQQFPTVGMEPDGDRIVVWSGKGIGDSNGIFARRYKEATDTAGPKVSDITTVSGERIGYGGQLTESPNYIVVVFDEEMMAGDPASVADSVLNTANYSLVKDGTVLVGAIRSINFDLNMASQMFPGVDQTNKWEAVIELDGNGTGAGVTALPAGQYEILISGTLRDVVGNPLYSSGLNPYGRDTTGQFNVVGFTSTDEEPVNDPPTGDQVLVGDTGAEYAPRAVASDGDGEFVVVWTDTTSGGIYARVYNDLRWSGNQIERISTGPIPADAFQVTDDATAMFASVARDSDGDFVVTWEQNDGTAADPDWNVWARRYDAEGRPFDDAFRVNSLTEGHQRYAAVAMDVDGDFVVTWQSNDATTDLEGRARDGDGYGIYAQRYSPSGQRLGGADEVQVLTFSESPVGTFTLFWDGDDDPGTSNVTAPIAIDGNPAASVEQIEAQLNVLGGDVNRVQVQATSLTEIFVYFVDQGAAKNQEQIVVANPPSFVNPVSSVTVSTLTEGYGGEFLVNDTTENNQMHPSIAMSAEGAFVVSWTSFGQDGDAANESNIYAKKFASNDSFRYAVNAAGARDYDHNARIQYPDAYFAVSTDSPDNHLVNPASGYDGVVQLIDPLTGGYGTGSLLRTGRHILTAAHVVDFGGGIPAPTMEVKFDTPDGPTSLYATEIYIHPGWNGDIFNANDLAIIVLPEEAPAEAERYDIYRASDELNQRVDMVGYGQEGQGAEYAVSDQQKRIEWNEYEALGDDLNGLPMADFSAGIGSFDIPAGTLLMYDFDSGLEENDALGMVLGIGDLGLGEEEGSSSHGDSGGPAFINGMIAGVVSGGVEYAPADSDATTFNVSFGTVGFHTRVSAYADWIEMIAQSTTGEFLVNDVPLDPTTGAALASGNQKWSSAAMDADGDFVITWTDELKAPDPNEHLDVMAKRFNADATEFEVTDPTTGLPAPLGEFQVNTAGDAARSQVAMDADGDFVVVWGNKAQRYAKNDLVGDSSLGANGELGGNFTVFTGGPGLYASVAVDDTGDTVFVREGYDSQNPTTLGIFFKRSEAAEDDAGPMVADVINVISTGPDVALQQLTDGVVIDEGPTTLIVSFSEDLIDSSPSLIDSITNPTNWILTRNGQVLSGGVALVEFGLNQTSTSPFPILPEATNKYEAVLTLDGDPSDPGNQPLGPGTYMLRIRSFVEDQFGNRLDGDYDGSPDGDFRRTFVVSDEAGGPALDGNQSRVGDPDADAEDELVNQNDAGNQDAAAVASDAEGNYVVVWVETADVLDLTGAPTGVVDSNIKARRYDRFGKPMGGEFIVNSYRTADQIEPAVAMNAYGSFVVTWSGEGEVDDQGTIELQGIFARVFDAFGQPVGEQFMVNQSGDARMYGQTAPSAAMDDRGDFTITWSSYGQDGDQDGVYARQYDFLGEAKDDEFPVNTTSANRQANSDIAMDGDGNFVIIWSGFEQSGDGSEWAVVGQRYNAAGAALGGEFVVNTHTLDDQTDVHVGMDADGNFVVTWASDVQDGSGWGIYARRYAAGGAAQGASFRVNQTTLHWQYQPDVSMDDDGRFVITWTTVGQDNPDADDRGIYARAYDDAGNDYVDPDTGLVVGEFRVNANVIGNQTNSAVALDADGDFAVVWTGPDDDQNGVYHRHFRINDVGAGTGGGTITGTIGGVYYADGSSGATSTVLALQGTSGDDTFEFIAGPTAATSVVLVNGVRYSINPAVLSIRFDGQGGNDEAIFKGSALNETIDLYPDHAAFSASRYAVSVTDVEWTFALGGGGTDYAILHDDPEGADTLKAWPSIAKLYGDGFYTIAKEFSHVHMYGTEGSGDMAVLYDDPHSADTFKAWPNQAKLYGDGFYNKVASFDSVYAYATEGGADVAILYDDPDGQDTLKAWPAETKLYGDGYFNRVSSFSSVYAYATKGNGDLAVLYDDPDGTDTFKAWPDQAKLYGEGYYNKVASFDSMFAYATKGGADVAVLYDQAGTRDTLKAWPYEAKLYGEGFYNKANGFSAVYAYATEGDGDKAILYDDAAGQDTLKAWPNEAKLYGDGYFNRVKGFYSVYAYATEGGNDVAKFYDSPSKDTFAATPESVKLYNGTYYNRASSFANVYAYSTNEGYDTAYLNDSALEEYPDHLEADANWARLSNELLGYAYFVSDFEEVAATQSNASDTEDVDTAALDFLFSTERNW